jgi:hypothetical protein
LRLLGVLIFIGGTAVVATACGPGDSGEISRSKLTTQVVHAICDNVVGCCEAAKRTMDLGRCRETVRLPFIGPVQDQFLAYDSERAARCVERLAATSRACQVADPAECLEAFVGNLPPGASCNSGLDCDEGPNGFAICDQSAHCVQPPRVGPGEQCAYSCVGGASGHPRCRSASTAGAYPGGAACHDEDGLTCAMGAQGSLVCLPLTSADCRMVSDLEGCGQAGICDLSSGHCLLRVPIGQQCSAKECVREAYCSNGICQQLKPLAGPCTIDDECQSGRCNLGFCAEFSEAAAAMCLGGIQP